MRFCVLPLKLVDKVGLRNWLKQVEAPLIWPEQKAGSAPGGQLAERADHDRFVRNEDNELCIGTSLHIQIDLLNSRPCVIARTNWLRTRLSRNFRLDLRLLHGRWGPDSPAVIKSVTSKRDAHAYPLRSTGIEGSQSVPSMDERAALCQAVSCARKSFYSIHYLWPERKHCWEPTRELSAANISLLPRRIQLSFQTAHLALPAMRHVYLAVDNFTPWLCTDTLAPTIV